MAENYKPSAKGACVKLSGGSGEWGEYIVPINEDAQVRASQAISQPVQELFEKIKSALLSGAEFVGGSLSAVAKFGFDMQDLLGYKLGGKSYYTQAWKGSKENAIDLKLEFKLGGKSGTKWSALDDVMIPASTLMGTTLPVSGGDNTISSPMPAPIDAFAKYGGDLIGISIKKAETDANNLSFTNNDIRNISTSEGAISGTQLASAATKYWDVSFGFYDGSKFVSVLKLGSHIVESSSVAYDTQYQQVGSGYYPIKATVTLSMKARDIYTSNIMGVVTGSTTSVTGNSTNLTEGDQ